MTTDVKELCSCEVGSMFARVMAERKMGTRHDVFGAEKLKSTGAKFVVDWVYGDPHRLFGRYQLPKAETVLYT